MPATVTRDIRTARQHANCRRTIAAEKRDAHKRERRAERMHVRALAIQVDPDTGQNAAPANQCPSTSEDCGGTVRCRFTVGHASDHHDGCVSWPNDGLQFRQADEPRKRQPRPLTGWDLW